MTDDFDQILNALKEGENEHRRDYKQKMLARYGPDPLYQPYRPCNGSEGEYFESEYCDECTQEDVEQERYCVIHTNALFFGIEEEHYPGETWVYFNGKPTCLAFRQRDDGDDDGRAPKPYVSPDPGQSDLFTPLPVIENVEVVYA